MMDLSCGFVPFFLINVIIILTFLELIIWMVFSCYPHHEFRWCGWFTQMMRMIWFDDAHDWLRWSARPFSGICIVGSFPAHHFVKIFVWHIPSFPYCGVIFRRLLRFSFRCFPLLRVAVSAAKERRISGTKKVFVFIFLLSFSFAHLFCTFSLFIFDRYDDFFLAQRSVLWR